MVDEVTQDESKGRGRGREGRNLALTSTKHLAHTICWKIRLKKNINFTCEGLSATPPGHR